MNRRSVSNPKALPLPSLDVHFGDNLPILCGLAEESFHLIYIDPPFNTGKTQSRSRLKTTRDADGDRIGFQGQRYRTTRLGSLEFPDAFSDYLDFLGPRLREAYRLSVLSRRLPGRRRRATRPRSRWRFWSGS